MSRALLIAAAIAGAVAGSAALSAARAAVPDDAPLRAYCMAQVVEDFEISRIEPSAFSAAVRRRRDERGLGASDKAAEVRRQRLVALCRELFFEQP